jgi:peptidoglycan/xylan/chitin deacetylase (PgdA/CDA1 family)
MPDERAPLQVTPRPTVRVPLPDGVRVAVTVNFDFEDDQHYRDLAPGFPDYRDVYERQFDGRVGVWRTLETLAAHDVTATYFICAALLKNYPDACRAVREQGHAIAGHTYHHEYLHLLDAAGERLVFQRQNEAFEDFYGAPLRGFRTCFASHRTLDFVADYGYEWDSSCRDDDLPYVIDREDGRSYLEIPRGVNGDAVLFGTPTENIFNTAKIGDPSDVSAHWKQEFDALHRHGAARPTIHTITLHPYNIGRPSRIRALAEYLTHTRQYDGVWYATYQDVCDWWRKGLAAQ